MEVRVLGELEVVGPGDVAIDVAGSRLRRLVTRLAVDAAQVVTASELVDAVWGDDPPADPVGALQTLVSRLRRVLGNPAVVQQSHQGYRLTIAADDVDANRFRGLSRQGRDRLAAGDAVTARRELTEALDLWRGPALADAEDAEYAIALVARLDEERLDAVTARIDADLALGHAADVVAELEDLTRANPLREQLSGQLMRALAATGRTAEALAAYERLRGTLADTLGTDPSPALRELHLALLREDVPTSSPVGRRPGLRVGLTSFLGREAEQARVLDVLEGARLATVVGPGGAGKTRLATEVGRSWQTDHGGAAALVELAPVRDESGVLPAFLAALDLREATVLEQTREARRGTDDLSLLLGTLQAGQHLLVVDNCEHLLDATARLVEELLASCPGLRVLATSREPLGVDGESLCVLPPLRLPPWEVSLDDAMSYASVQLFVERAGAVRSGPVLDEGTLAPVVEIVRRLDGLPLAIELAAARTRVLPVVEVAARLSDRFRLLTGGRRTALPRHQTLRAVVEWSWELLTPDERLLAERLAVFPAGSTPASATAVCGDARLPADEVSTLLGSLVDKSLLTVDEAAGLRYRMLETIREFGIDRLAERGEVDEARLRHAGYFADVVSRESRRLYGAEQLDAARKLDAEHDNIVSAIRYLGDSGDAQRTMRMVLELSWYWSLVGAHAEAWTWIDFALRTPGEVDPSARALARAVMLMSRGMEDNTAFELDSTSRAAEIQAELEQLPDPDYAMPQAVVMRTMLAYFAGDEELAEQKRLAALDHPDPWVRAAMRMLRAAMAENFGDVDGVRDNVGGAYDEFAAIGDRWGLATVVAMRAQLQMYDGDLEGAIASYRQAEEYMGTLGAHSDEGFMAMRIAVLLLRLGDLDGARREIARFDELEDASGFGKVLGSSARGWVAVHEGDVAAMTRVRDTLAAETDRNRTRGGAHGLALMSSMLVILDLELGQVDAAAKCAAVGYRASLATKDLPILAGLGTAVARLAAAFGRDEDAAERLGAAARVRGIEDPTDPTVVRLTRELTEALGAQGFADAYERGWSLTKEAAAERLDPASLDVGGVEPVVEAQARRR
ncbi:MAG TPA: BTAD domain-containing putative transcriptional regulator [Lapillicoccus sp.]|nr:BTAD domain-containing putative transcriptional regulator [Lapillicoccus sp.]